MRSASNTTKKKFGSRFWKWDPALCFLFFIALLLNAHMNENSVILERTMPKNCSKNVFGLVWTNGWIQEYLNLRHFLC